MLSLVDCLRDTEGLLRLWFWLCISVRAVPERYEINAGIIGKMHGEKNDPAPARADIKTLASAVIHAACADFWINTFFQISTRSLACSAVCLSSMGQHACITMFVNMRA